mgnify:CR=1 FL=1
MNKGKEVLINMPDINESESFSLNDLSYTKPRDYFKSGIKVCIEEGLTFSKGIDAEISSNIPFQAGCSSSSAIMVGWIHFLSQIADEPIHWKTEKIGRLAYRSEVLEFGEPGGMMDQYSTAIGGLIYLNSDPEISIEALHALPGAFVLGDSQTPKKTLSILKRCKDNRLSIFQKISNKYPQFNLQKVQLEEINNYNKFLNKEEYSLIQGTIHNRDYLRKGLSELKSKNPNYKLIAKLLTQHQAVLKDILKVSTSEIDKMLDAALNEGALGGKINGSGGGGCMFVYAPENPENVAEAIEKVGGKAYIISPGEGTKVVS